MLALFLLDINDQALLLLKQECIMKKIFLVVMTTILSGVAFAQVDSTSQSGISDEDLKKYAVTMDSINGMKQTLLSEISNMVKSNESMTNARYNDLNKAGEDQAKLTELKATPEEIAFMKQVDEAKNSGAAKISETFQTLAKDYVGVETYNKVKNSLATDSALKERYTAILNKIETDGTASTR